MSISNCFTSLQLNMKHNGNNRNNNACGGDNFRETEIISKVRYETDTLTGKLHHAEDGITFSLCLRISLSQKSIQTRKKYFLYFQHLSSRYITKLKFLKSFQFSVRRNCFVTSITAYLLVNGEWRTVHGKYHANFPPCLKAINL